MEAFEMKKLILIFVVTILSSCNVYDIAFNVNVRQMLHDKFEGEYASILNNVHFLNNVDFIGKTFNSNGIELTILYAFGLGDRIYDFIYNEETGKWIEDEDSVFIPINSYVLFSINDTLDRLDFLIGNRDNFGGVGYLTREFELNFGLEFGEFIQLFLEYYDDGTAYFLARNFLHELFYENEFEDEFKGEIYIEFSLESILLDSYPYTIEVGISDSFYSNVLMIEDF